MFDAGRPRDDEMAALFGVSRRTIYRIAGKPPSTRIHELQRTMALNCAADPTTRQRAMRASIGSIDRVDSTAPTTAYNCLPAARTPTGEARNTRQLMLEGLPYPRRPASPRTSLRPRSLAPRR